ncbi:MAG TPA: tyrosine-protein phosphatase [Thermodesulfovibrionales bacterium]|nr:tyrosine-protein phosphatase [Thermodesulfovibrionales bacterium]
MYEHQDRNIGMARIVAAVGAILILASCAHVHTSSKEEKSRIVRVSEGIYRGPRLDDLNELRSLKIRTILNLEDNSEAVQRESEAAGQLGIVMINIPMSQISRPKTDDLLRAVRIMEDQGSLPVYVHCLHGRDRTGFVIASYKIIHNGWTLEKAYQEALDNGHNKWFYESILGWKESLWLMASRKTSAQVIP